MKLDNVIFLAALSPRSQSYAQALKANGIKVEKVILFSESAFSVEMKKRPNEIKDKHLVVENIDIPLPNLQIPLKQTCKFLADEIIEVSSDHVNNPMVLDTLRDCKPDLVIYSGYGGQIVSQNLLIIAPFLHVHAGWLPQYRGSTTLYYSIIKDRNCGVSAILLEPEIDTGVVVARRQFPIPPSGIDVDHEYDGAIRSKVLLEALIEWRRNGDFLRHEQQSDSDSETYYVIHPVLKHIALLSLPNN